MSPTIVEDANGGFVLSVSSAGGSRIISAIAQVIRNTVDFGHNALEALAAPRLHDQIYPPVLAMEQDMPLLGFKGCGCAARSDCGLRTDACLAPIVSRTRRSPFSVRSATTQHTSRRG